MEILNGLEVATPTVGGLVGVKAPLAGLMVNMENEAGVALLTT